MAEAELRPYEPTWGDRIRWLLMGQSRPSVERARFAQGVSDLVGMTPVGIPDAVRASREATNRGSYADAVLQAAAALPAARPLSGAALQAVQLAKMRQLAAERAAMSSGISEDARLATGPYARNVEAVVVPSGIAEDAKLATRPYSGEAMITPSGLAETESLGPRYFGEGMPPSPERLRQEAVRQEALQAARLAVQSALSAGDPRKVSLIDRLLSPQAMAERRAMAELNAARNEAAPIGVGAQSVDSRLPLLTRADAINPPQAVAAPVASAVESNRLRQLAGAGAAGGLGTALVYSAQMGQPASVGQLPTFARGNIPSYGDASPIDAPVPENRPIVPAAVMARPSMAGSRPSIVREQIPVPVRRPTDLPIQNVSRETSTANQPSIIDRLLGSPLGSRALEERMRGPDSSNADFFLAERARADERKAGGEVEMHRREQEHQKTLQRAFDVIGKLAPKAKVQTKKTAKAKGRK